ncbi:MAG: LamG-like jellyroll fold domain-containing protein, partial [Candidatus Micrarchaeia archaeon]
GIISKKKNDSAKGYVIYNDGNKPTKLNLRFLGNTALDFTSASDVSLNTWQHWILRYNASSGNLSWYRDGVLDNSTTVFIGDLSSNESLQIGRSQTWNGYFKGLIDEVRIYNRALSDEEIKIHNLMEFQKYNISNYKLSFSLREYNKGEYSYYIYAVDNLGQNSTSEIRFITLNITDIEPPSIQLILPSDNSYINSSTVTFTFNATDDTSNTLACSIYIDNELNQTNNSIINGSLSQFVITGLSDNQHTWKINCSDEAGNSNVSETRTFTIDTIPPSLSFVPPTPDNERSITTANVLINVSANENLSSCKLNWNGSEYMMTIQNADALTYAFYNVTGFDFGTYSYYVTCNDTAGNFNSTETRSVSYIEYIEVVVSPTSLNFGLLDPLTNSTSDISINVTNTENSNVPIYISFIGTDFISGSNILGIGNLTVRANATKPSYEYFTQDHSLSTDELSCTPVKYSLDQDCSNISRGQQVNLWFNIRIPGGQAAGDYIANITIKANGKK